jgi:hypothetical protein
LPLPVHVKPINNPSHLYVRVRVRVRVGVSVKVTRPWVLRNYGGLPHTLGLWPNISLFGQTYRVRVRLRVNVSVRVRVKVRVTCRVAPILR